MKIINSLLDTDFYKFTMQQAVFHNYTDVNVRYAFRWRNWSDMHLNITLKDFAGRLKDQLDQLCELEFSKEELEYLKTIPFLKSDYIEYLRLFKLNRDHIKVSVEHEQLKVIIEGPWLSTILFEVPVLAIISELYTRNNGIKEDIWLSTAIKKFNEKVVNLYNQDYELSEFMFGDFGTRRRACALLHDDIIKKLTIESTGHIGGPRWLTGTSNVLLAMKYNVKPLGTMAHEWIQAHQQLGVKLIDSQKQALQAWADEYRGELGIALSDCITFDAFLADFDRYFALLFDGCRHDSGNPFEWCEKLIKHYKKLRIDPRTKTALFSDGLNFEVAVELFKRYNDIIKTAFGIGTYLTNDCGFIAPQIVIKMTHCNGKPVAKISDSPGKGMCEDYEYLTYLKKVISEKINENRNEV
jgi:nicotinate phosphoribosyltransferase